MWAAVLVQCTRKEKLKQGCRKSYIFPSNVLTEGLFVTYEWWFKKLLKLTLRRHCTQALVQLIRLQLFRVLILILKDLLEVSHFISSLFLLHECCYSLGCHGASPSGWGRGCTSRWTSSSSSLSYPLSKHIFFRCCSSSTFISLSYLNERYQTVRLHGLTTGCPPEG